MRLKIETSRKRPKELKGVKRSIHVKTVDSWYSSYDVYKVGKDCYIFFRSRVPRHLVSLWIIIKDFEGSHEREFKQALIDHLGGDEFDALHFIVSHDITRSEFVDLFKLDFGLKKSILFDPLP